MAHRAHPPTSHNTLDLKPYPTHFLCCKLVQQKKWLCLEKVAIISHVLSFENLNPNGKGCWLSSRPKHCKTPPKRLSSIRGSKLCKLTFLESMLFRRPGCVHSRGPNGYDNTLSSSQGDEISHVTTSQKIQVLKGGETSMDSLNDPHKVSFLNVCDKRRFRVRVSQPI